MPPLKTRWPEDTFRPSRIDQREQNAGDRPISQQAGDVVDGVLLELCCVGKAEYFVLDDERAVAGELDDQVELLGLSADSALFPLVGSRLQHVPQRMLERHGESRHPRDQIAVEELP